MSDKKLNIQEMDQVAGGTGGQADGNSNYPNCPNCGSSNVRFVYEHDEVGVFQCNDCHNQFSNRYGE